MGGLGEGLEALYKFVGCLLFLGLPVLFIGGLLVGHFIWK
jgi:hypothetical protein